MTMGVSQVLLTSPVRVVGAIIALRTIVLGAAYALGTDASRATVLWGGIAELINPKLFGVFFAATGLMALAGWASKNNWLIRFSSTKLAVFYIFQGLIYLFNGAYYLSFAHAFSWGILAFYMSYIWDNKISSQYED